MPSHPIDFQFQANVFATPELLAIFDEQARLGRWLSIEAALAMAQADLGLIPRAAAEEIGAKADLSRLDLSQLEQEFRQSRNSLLPLVKTLRRACLAPHGDYVHFGITTQDVIDTGQILELQSFFKILYRDVRRLEEILLALAERHRTTPMIGRTHGQQAIPITFGFKVAVWLHEVRRHLERLKSLAGRTLVGQISGAVGTMAALGPEARAVACKTCAYLGLSPAELTWHTCRDNIAEVASYLAILTATLEKIANEVFQLGKTELGELRESNPGAGMSSSTMPHKNNPVLCQRVAVLARQVRALAGLVIDAMVHEHERDARSLWSEWLNVPQISIYTGTAVHYVNEVMQHLTVVPDRMLHNLHLQKEMVISEWLLFQLGERLGRTKVQERLHSLIRQAATAHLPLSALLVADEEIGPLLGQEQLEILHRPELYTGQAANLVDRTIAQIRALRKSEPDAPSFCPPIRTGP